MLLIANPTINKALYRLPLLAVPVLFPRPSIACVAKPTFLTHFLVSMPNPALKLSKARTSLDSFLLVLRKIVSFAIRSQGGVEH